MSIALVNPYANLLTSDPYIASVVNLTHFDQGNGSTGPFTNSVGSGLPFTSTGPTVVTSTTQIKFGVSSLRTPGNSSQFSGTSTTDTDYQYGTGDFTIEFWIRTDTVTGAQVYFDQRPGAEGAYPSIYASGTSLRYYVSSADRITGTVLAATTWQFIAVSRVSGSTRMYCGTSGTAAQVGSTYTDSSTYLLSGLRVGYGGFTTGPTAGYYDEFRITKGVGRYSGTTCPVPTAAFPNS